MRQVGELDRTEAINATRKVACFLRCGVQVLQKLESDLGELFSQRARVETGYEGLANALKSQEEVPNVGRLIRWKKHGRIRVVHDQFTVGGGHRPDRRERVADRLARQVVRDAQPGEERRNLWIER